jgi:hypothetical protein
LRTWWRRVNASCTSAPDRTRSRPRRGDGTLGAEVSPSNPKLDTPAGVIPIKARSTCRPR